MEIYHGFLRKPFTPAHALCYERDSSFISTIPTEKERKIFDFDYPNDPEVMRRRDKLIDDIRNHQYAKSSSYPAMYGGMDEEGKAIVTGLQDFEKMVLEDLWEAVATEFPPPPPPPSELALERSYHNHFVDERSRQFIGRKDLVDELDGIASSGAHTESLPFVVVGAPGSGKTSLVTAFAKHFSGIHPRVFVLVHVVSASPTSTDIRETLLRLSRELIARFDLEGCTVENDDYQTIKENFPTVLEKAGSAAMEEKTHVLLVIDAINQFNPFYGAHTMDWLPAYMPTGVKAILSTTPDAYCLTALQKRDPRPPQLDVPPLEFSERCEIVRNALAEYRKKLLPNQMNLLMEKTESSKPLYLLTVCEELRLQAQYGVEGSGVDRKIRQFPGEIPTLLDVVLERVEKDLSTWANSTDTEIAPARSALESDEDEETVIDGGHMIVRDALSLLECSRHGLRENELLELLAPPGKNQLPPVVWARLYRSLELYLRPLGEEDESMLGFFHHQMMEAVRRRYLQYNRRAEAAVCTRLTEYFFNKADPSRDGKWLGDQKRYFLDLVYYQLRALDLAGLQNTLGNLLFIQRRAEQGVGSMEHLLRDYHDAQEELRTLRYSLLKEKIQQEQSEGEEADFSAARASLLHWIGEFLVFVSSHHSTLASYPSLTFQYALNQPDSSTPFQSASKIVADECEQILQLLREKDEKNRQLASEQLSSIDEGKQTNGETQDQKRQSVHSLKQGVARQLEYNLDSACDGVGTEIAPRRFMEWCNKPQKNRMVADFAGYNFEVACISLNPDSSLIAIGFKSGTIQVIDADIGEMIRELSTGGHTTGVTCLAFSSDGLRLISGSFDTNVIVWDALTGSLLSSLVEHSGTVTSVAWLEGDTKGKRSRTVATAALDSVIKVWEEKIQSDTYSAGSEEETRYEVIWDQSWLQSPIMAMQFNKTTKTLIVGYADGQAQLWDAHAPNLGLIPVSQFTAHKYMQAVSTIALSPDGTYLATGSLDQTVKLWEKRMMDTDYIWKEVELHGKGHNGAITCLDFSPDGQKLVTASLDKKLLLWDVMSGKEIVALNGHAEAVYSVEFNQNGDRVISGSYDKTVKTWDVEGVDDYGVVAPVKRADHHGKAIKSPRMRRSYVPRRRRLGRRASTSKTPVSSDSPGSSGSPFAEHEPAGFFRDTNEENVLARRFGSTSEYLNANDLGIPSGAHAEAVKAVTINYKGTYAATGSSDKCIKIWSVAKAHEIVVLIGHNSSITSLMFIGNDEFLVSGDAGGNIMIWDGSTFDHLRTIHAYYNASVDSMTWCDLRERNISDYTRDLIIFSGASEGTVKSFMSHNGLQWDAPTTQCFPRHVGVSSMRYIPITRSRTPLDCSPAPVNSGRLEPFQLRRRTANHSDHEGRRVALRNLLAKAMRHKNVEQIRPDSDDPNHQEELKEYEGIMKMIRMYIPSFTPTVQDIAAAIPKTTLAMLHEEAMKGVSRKKRKKKKDKDLNEDVLLEDVRTILENLSGRSNEETEELLKTWETEGAKSCADPPASVTGTLDTGYQRDRVVCVGSSGQVCVLDMFSMTILFSSRLCDARGGSVKLSAIDPLGARIAASARTKFEALHTIVSPAGQTENRVSLVMDLRNEQNENTRKEEKDNTGLKPKEVLEKERQEKADLETQKRVETFERKLKEKEERKAKRRAEKLKQNMLNGTPIEDSDSSDENDSQENRSQNDTGRESEEDSPFRKLQERSHDRTCSAMAFSHDGTLIGCGSVEKVISLVDSSRPHLGPLAQFLAFGEVTAIGVGPGILPWNLDNFYVDEDDSTVSALDLVQQEEPEDVKLCTAEYLENFISSQEKKLEKLAARPRVGDGQGNLGLLVAGDSTGAVFILRLKDIMRKSEAEFFDSLVERMRERKQAIIDEASEELERRRVEEENLDDEDSGNKHAAPLQELTFSNNRTATAARLPRVLSSSSVDDVKLCEHVLNSFDIEFPESVELIPLSESLKLAEAFCPRKDERGKGMINEYRKIEDSGESLSVEDKEMLDKYEEEERRNVNDSTSSAHDPNLSERMRKVEEMRKKQKRRQEEEEAAEKLQETLPLMHKYFHSPKSLVCIFGGAAGLHDLLVPGLKTLIQKGAAVGAIMSGAMILDGGTEAGVMSMIGSALQPYPEHIIRLLGVVPAGVVKLPGDEELHKNVTGKTPLESHHSNFALVPSKEWGGETSSMFTLARAIRYKLPTVAILANGGFISKKEIVNAVRQKIPVIVISGSGRLADKLTLAINSMNQGDTGPYESAVADDDVREIVTKGEIHLYKVTGAPEGLQDLVCELVRLQRDRMLADSYTRQRKQIPESLQSRLNRGLESCANAHWASEVAKTTGYNPLP